MNVRDSEGHTISSKMFYRGQEMDFCTGFVARIEHLPGDSLPVPPPPSPNCTCPLPLRQ